MSLAENQSVHVKDENPHCLACLADLFLILTVSFKVYQFQNASARNLFQLLPVSTLLCRSFRVINPNKDSSGSLALQLVYCSKFNIANINYYYIKIILILYEIILNNVTRGVPTTTTK